MSDMQSYGMTRKLNKSYEETIELVTAALKEEGFGVLTTIDVKSTMKEKIDADFRKYVILGACNPHLAHKALTTDLQLGLLLPCNAIVYEEGDGSVVSMLNPGMMMQIANNDELNAVAAEAQARLQRALASLPG